MSTIVRCPGCKRKLRAPEGWLGKKMRCPSCQTVVIVHEPDLAEGITAPEPREEAVLAISQEVEEPKPKRRKLGTLSRALTLGLGLIVGLGTMSATSWFIRSLFQKSAAVIPDSQWQPMTVPGHLKAQFPGVAKRSVQSEAGMTMISYSVEPDKQSVYSLSYSQAPLPAHRLQLQPEVVLNDSCDGALARLKDQGGQEVSRQSIQLGPHLGKEMVINIAKAGGKLMLRNYLVRGHIYILIAGGVGFGPDHANIRKFFDSFEVLEDPSPTSSEPPPVPKSSSIPMAQPKPELTGGAFHQIVLQPEFGAILQVGFSNDGRTLVVATSAEQVFWYDAQSLELLVRTPADKKRPLAGNESGCAISPDGSAVAFTRHGGLIYLVSRNNPGQEIVLKPASRQGGPPFIWRAVFSADSKLLCTVISPGMAEVWDIASRKNIQGYPTNPDQIAIAAYSPDGSFLVTADKELIIWYVQKYMLVGKVPGPGQFYINALAISPKGDYLVYAHNKSMFVLPIDRTGGAIKPNPPAKEIALNAFVQAIAFTPDGRQVLCALDNRSIKSWDVASLKAEKTISLQSAPAATALTFRPADKVLAAACGNRVLLFDRAKAE